MREVKLEISIESREFSCLLPIESQMRKRQVQRAIGIYLLHFSDFLSLLSRRYFFWLLSLVILPVIRFVSLIRNSVVRRKTVCCYEFKGFFWINRVVISIFKWRKRSQRWQRRKMRENLFSVKKFCEREKIWDFPMQKLKIEILRFHNVEN